MDHIQRNIMTLSILRYCTCCNLDSLFLLGVFEKKEMNICNYNITLADQ